MNEAVRTTREIWGYNRDLERIEAVCRCTYCAVRKDRHNGTADMAYYGYSAHNFQYPGQEEVEQWEADLDADGRGGKRRGFNEREADTDATQHLDAGNRFSVKEMGEHDS
jgi:hypothetical protein